LQSIIFDEQEVEEVAIVVTKTKERGFALFAGGISVALT